MIRTHPSLLSRCNVSLVLVLGLLLLSSIPFVPALEIHHLFADVDHDGHQHSDFDLCQWIQHHTSNSLVWDVPPLSHGSVVIGFLPLDREETYLSLTFPLGNPRGPPDSFFS
ncbi:MAG: hypothetical protein CO149_07255 [Nitrospirae bacterium CG_4_9_14_3_um_filter_51_5]|nr:MAG: hypothetical protein CO149_07255 [Nitrospirae bacterium CG_4_9_14_3_um_filter_51_5]